MSANTLTLVFILCHVSITRPVWCQWVLLYQKASFNKWRSATGQPNKLYRCLRSLHIMGCRDDSRQWNGANAL